MTPRRVLLTRPQPGETEEEFTRRLAALLRAQVEDEGEPPTPQTPPSQEQP